MTMNLQAILTARFLVRGVPPNGDLWEITPGAMKILQRERIPFDGRGNFSPPDTWRKARTLINYESIIAENSTQFKDLLTEMIELWPSALNTCTVHVSKYEFSMLRTYGNDFIYNFFVKGHRFGAPPRGREYRSDVRGPWKEKEGALKVDRPDNALLALRRKIDRSISYGLPKTEIDSLEKEFLRRKQAIADGKNWREGYEG